MSIKLKQNNQTIAKNTLFLYLRLAIVMAVNLYSTRVVLEVLGVSDYGTYNIVCGFVSMFGVLNTSMSNGIQRFYNYELGKGGESALLRVFNTSIIIQIVLAFIIVVILETVGLWYLNYQMEIPSDRMVAANYIYQFSVISMAFVILQVPYGAAILAHEKMDFYAIVCILDVFIKLIVVIIIPYIPNDSLIMYGLLLSLVAVLNFICNYAYCKHKFTYLKFQNYFDKPLFKTMFTFSGWNLFGTFAYMMKGQGVNVLLNAFWGTIVNAANGIATQISSVIQSFALNLTLAFKPQLTQSYAQGDYQRTESLMFSMSKLSFTLVSIIAIPIMVDLDFILSLWLGENVPDHTILFTRLVIITMLVSVLNTPITQVIHATGKMRRYQLTTSIIICSTLPISWIFLKLGFAPESVFYVGIVVTIINQVACVGVLKTVFNYDICKYMQEVALFCCLILIAPLFGAYCIYSNFSVSIIQFIMMFIVCTILICMSALLLFNKEEKQMIYLMCNKILKTKK